MSKCSTIPQIKVTDQVKKVISTEELVLQPELKRQTRSNCPTSSEECTLLKGEKAHTYSGNVMHREDSNEKGSPPHSTDDTSTMHTLSKKISQQFKSEKAIKARELDANTAKTYTAFSAGRPPQETFNAMHQHDTISQRDKMKKVLFLSRLAIKGGKKKEQFEDREESQKKNGLTEDLNAYLFSSLNVNAFVPRCKEPPTYIKVRSRNKKHKAFDHMFLAQELSGSTISKRNTIIRSLHSTNGSGNKNDPTVPESNGAIWAMEFSLDGRYLAAAGCEQIVKVWAVLSSFEERQAYEHEKRSSEIFDGKRLSAPVFRSKPIREYSGHNGNILDLNWSKNNFLLTVSLDKMVKLWHPTRQECLCTFNQEELITSIFFHPTDDRFFLAGSLDCILRLWSIPEKKVIYSYNCTDPITAVAFTPNGSIAIAGGFSGLCHFFDLNQEHGFISNSQIHVRSSRGKNAKGSKITGIKTASFVSDEPDASNVNILITSNDSRIRLYSLKDKRLEMKLQGHENTHSQIKASFSDDGLFVICGSEDRKTYIWNIKSKDFDPKEVPPAEFFHAHSNTVTTAILAPASTRRLLLESGDPIYNICNRNANNLVSLDNYHVEVSSTSDYLSSTEASKKELTQAHIAPTFLDDGPIIVTSDSTGSVKCFRIDCAYEKRHQWDASSMLSKKRSSLRRTESSMTRTSTSSCQNSLDQSSASTSIHREKILNFRGKLSDSFARTSLADETISPEKPLLQKNQFSATSFSRNNSGNWSERCPDMSPLKAKTVPANRIVVGPVGSTTLPPIPGFSLTNNNESEGLKQCFNQTCKHSSLKNISSWRTLRLSVGRYDKEKMNLAKDYSKENNSSNTSKEEFFTDISKSHEENNCNIDNSESSQLCCEMCEGDEFKVNKVPGKGLVMVCVGCGVTIDEMNYR